MLHARSSICEHVAQPGPPPRRLHHTRSLLAVSIPTWERKGKESKTSSYFNAGNRARRRALGRHGGDMEACLVRPLLRTDAYFMYTIV